MINDLINGNNAEEVLQETLLKLHDEGPVDTWALEQLAYIKSFHSELFAEYESRILYSMGLFYKTGPPGSLLEEVYSLFANAITDETGRKFTPVQAGAYRAIRDNIYYSFAAPTSAGKSYLFRELIRETKGDIVIVLPSRALISEYIHEVLELVDKNVLVLQFIENINTAKIDRRIFIVTPERAIELFKKKDLFNIELFLLDEAQLSEEGVRGLKFDSFVRRISRAFPEAKKVFAHPFVSNPEAQLIKHRFEERAAYRSFEHQSVGKIFLSHKNGSFAHFSPNVVCDPVACPENMLRNLMLNNGTMLIYTSKSKIYDNRHLSDFADYVDLCEPVENEKALSIISELKDYIGASNSGRTTKSTMIEMMRRGVVIHHGSMPLKARLIVEEFVKNNFAKICFATSTLIQGINMPFDAVWIDNFTNMNPLTLKNLIGRSGRSTSKKNQFDFGYTIINEANVPTFSSRFKETYRISDSSILDADVTKADEDDRDLIEAIKEDTFNDDLNLTESQVERIEQSKIDDQIAFLLNTFIVDGEPLSGNEYYALGNLRAKVKTVFQSLFVQHLRRKGLTRAEKSIVSAAIPVMLWQVQGKSFSEIVSLRRGYLTKRDERRAINRKLREGKITAGEAKKIRERTFMNFSPIPSRVPNKSHRLVNNYARTPIDDLEFDKLVYETYDYIDKVVSLSLSDPICAILQMYQHKHNDHRAGVLANYIRYGTNDSTEIWLLRYGFAFEDIEWMLDHVESVDSRQIVFKDSIENLPNEKKEVIERFI